MLALSLTLLSVIASCASLCFSHNFFNYHCKSGNFVETHSPENFCPNGYSEIDL